jgi:hypothetical protein
MERNHVNRKTGIVDIRHKRAQHISVITRQPGPIRDSRSPSTWVPENSAKSFKGAESSRGVLDLRINTYCTLITVRQTTFTLDDQYT